MFDEDMMMLGEETSAHKYSIGWGDPKRWTYFYAGIGPGYGMTAWTIEIGQLSVSWFRRGR